MKFSFLKLLSIVALYMAASSCGSAVYEPEREVSKNEFQNRFHISTCDTTNIRTSNEVSATISPFYRSYVLKFSDISCFNRFYEDVRSASTIYKIVGDKDYDKSMGVLKETEILFLINKMNNLELSFSEQK